MLKCQKFAVVPERDIKKASPHLPPECYLYSLGISGLTAFFGLFEIGMPKRGDTVLVSTAAGAVGSIVVQLARKKKCRVVGIAGTPEKWDYVVSKLGADACLNFNDPNFPSALGAALPNGIDVYFDNVGGH
jgi:NADPH-dependent curcumin reductase CurA